MPGICTLLPIHSACAPPFETMPPNNQRTTRHRGENGRGSGRKAIEADTAPLVGIERRRIVAETKRLLRNGDEYRAIAQADSPFGDCRVAERTVKILRERL
jgi:hypothetical protein